MRTSRVLAAFVIAPLTPTLLAFLLVVSRAEAKGQTALFGDLGRFLMLNVAVAYPLAIIAGVPAYLATRGTAFAHWAVYAGIGIALGFLTAAMFGPDPMALTPSAAQQAVMAFGGASVFVFWLIARPDRHRDA
jgi:hypothetical protein